MTAPFYSPLHVIIIMIMIIIIIMVTYIANPICRETLEALYNVAKKEKHDIKRRHIQFNTR